MKTLSDINIVNDLRVGDLVLYRGQKKTISIISWNKEKGYYVWFEGENKPNYELEKMELLEKNEYNS